MKDKNIKKISIITLTSIIGVILACCIGFYVYSLDYYKADETATQILNAQNVSVEEDVIKLTPSTPSDTAIIFYPGGKVEYTAYLPILNKLTEKGYTCFVQKMPLNFAIFGINSANEIIENNEDIENWYIAGHSLGGAMASKYASQNLYKLKGLILLGSYVYGQVPEDKYIVIYGDNDLVLDKTKLKGVSNELVIQGGNHAMFGNYGQQKGDGLAEISTEEQQNLTVDWIQQFITKTNF